jgi:16S rRNA processing protein RimM
VKEYYLIAKIVSVYGKDGYVKIFSYSDFPERFLQLKSCYVDFSGKKKLLKIDSAAEKKGSLLLKFENFSSAKDVEILLGREVFVDEQDVVKLPEFTFFIHDLIGSEVFEDGISIGTITDVLSYPANDVYVLEGADGKELLIPSVKEMIESFDPMKKIMILKKGSSLYDED